MDYQFRFVGESTGIKRLVIHDNVANWGLFFGLVKKSKIILGITIACFFQIYTSHFNQNFGQNASYELFWMEKLFELSIGNMV